MTASDVLRDDASKQNYELSWQKEDTAWMLGLYGTAVGAGTLFLPINAGMHGILPLLVMCVLAFPLTYFAHRGLCRFVLASSVHNHHLSAVVCEHFGQRASAVISWLYFLAVFPILLLYSVAITNTTQSFMINQLDIAAPPRMLLALILILALMAIVRLGQQWVVKALGILVYPFVFILLALALYLIPYWNLTYFTQTALTNTPSPGFFLTLWLSMPVMVFAFNHAAIISTFAIRQRQRFGQDADRASNRIMRYSHAMMVATVMFFVLSCVLSLSPANLLEAKSQNISILSYLANHFNTPFLAVIAPLIAFVAISKSFLGHYLGASESMLGLIEHYFSSLGVSLGRRRLQWVIEGLIILICWLVATLNPSILGMIELLVGPVVAIILYLMPMYAISKVPSMKRYQNRFSNVFTTLVGLVTLSAIAYGFLGH